MKSIVVFSVIGVLLPLGGPHAFANAQAATVTRDEMIERLLKNVKLSKGGTLNLELSKAGTLDRDAEKAEVFVREIESEVRRVAPNIFPDTMSATSNERLQKFLSKSIIVSHLNMTYNSALIEEWLRSIKVDFAAEKLIEPLKPATKQGLKQNITALSNAVQSSMVQNLAGYFSEEEIAEDVKRHRRSWLDRVDEPITYYLRIPVGEGDIKEIAGEFDIRLAESIKRIPKRLNRAQERAEKMKLPREREEYLRSMKRLILVEITPKPFSLLSRKTADPELLSIDPNTLDPGYVKAVARLHSLEPLVLAEKRRFYEKKDLLRERQNLLEESQQGLERIAKPPLDIELANESVDVLFLHQDTQQKSQGNLPIGQDKNEASSLQDSPNVPKSSRESSLVFLWVGAFGIAVVTAGALGVKVLRTTKK